MSLRFLTRSFSSHAPRRIPKYVGRTALLASTLGAGYLVDRHYNASSITRTLRTLHTVSLHSCPAPCPVDRFLVCHDHAGLQMELYA